MTGRRQRGDFADMRTMQHLVKHLLQHYQRIVIPNTTAVSQNKECNPSLWPASFPKSIQKRLISSKNPNQNITNSDLELVSGIIFNDAAAQNFDIQEQTVHSNTDNTPTLSWTRKGSTNTSNATAYLLRA